MIRLHLHIGAGALIGPASDWPSSRPLDDKDDEVEEVEVVGVASVKIYHRNKKIMMLEIIVVILLGLDAGCRKGGLVLDNFKKKL